MTQSTDHDALVILHSELKRIIEVLPKITDRLEALSNDTRENCTDIKWVKLLLGGTWATVSAFFGWEWWRK